MINFLYFKIRGFILILGIFAATLIGLNDVHAAASQGIVNSFVANRLSSNLPNTHAAFWDAVRVNPGVGGTFCASDVKVLALSIINAVDAQGRYENKTVSQVQATFALASESFSLTDADGNEVPLETKIVPAQGAKKWENIISPQTNGVARTCHDFFYSEEPASGLETFMAPQGGEQCFGKTYAAFLDLPPGTYTLTATFVDVAPFSTDAEGNLIEQVSTVEIIIEDC